MASRFIVGVLPMLIALFSGPVGAEFDERDSTTAHRQELFPRILSICLGKTRRNLKRASIAWP